MTFFKALQDSLLEMRIHICLGESTLLTCMAVSRNVKPTIQTLLGLGSSLQGNTTCIPRNCKVESSSHGESDFERGVLYCKIYKFDIQPIVI